MPYSIVKYNNHNVLEPSLAMIEHVPRTTEVEIGPLGSEFNFLSGLKTPYRGARALDGTAAGGTAAARAPRFGAFNNKIR